MYPTKNRDNINPCVYSSAEFVTPPTTAICRGESSYLNYSINTDGDSLSYHWAQPIDPPIAAPVPLIYRIWFNYDNPTPDETFDSRNIPSQLNEKNRESKAWGVLWCRSS